MSELTLAFDSCYHWIVAGIFDGEQEIRSISIDADRNSSTRLIIELKDLLNKTEVNRPDRILCSLGPGSLTGVRITVSTARNLCQLWQIPGAGVTGLDYLLVDSLSKYEDKYTNAAIMIDGKQQKYYCKTTSSSSLDMKPEEFIEQYKPDIIFTDSLNAINGMVEKNPQISNTIQIHPVQQPQAYSLIKLLEKNQPLFSSYENLIPLYLREDPATASLSL